MKKLVPLCVMCLFSIFSNGQVLVNDLMGDQERIVFNKTFIKENAIHTITIQEQVKKRGQTILDLNKSQKMFYDENGEILSKSKIGEMDTTWSDLMQYVFENDKKISEYISVQGGCSITNYSYDDHNQLIEVISGKSSEELKEYTEDSFTRIGIQKFEWKEIRENVIQKKVLNSLGKPYMLINYSFDSTGVYLQEIRETYTISNRSALISFSYDEKGRLQSEVKDKLVINYYYDDNDNILSEIHYDNGDETHRLEYVYNGEGLLSAKLLKYDYSPTVFINKYSYEYR